MYNYTIAMCLRSSSDVLQDSVEIICTIHIDNSRRKYRYHIAGIVVLKDLHEESNPTARDFSDVEKRFIRNHNAIIPQVHSLKKTAFTVHSTYRDFCLNEV